MKKKYIHVYLIQKYIKDILKCPFLHQLYTIRYKYTNVQNINIYIHTYMLTSYIYRERDIDIYIDIYQDT